MSVFLGFIWTAGVALKIAPYHSTKYSVGLWLIGMISLAVMLQKIEDFNRRLR